MTTVTITVPPRCAAVPAVDGDPAAVASFAKELLATAVNLDDFDTFTHDAANLSGWYGRAADAYRSYTRSTGADGHAVSNAVRQVARAADAFAEDLADLLRRRSDLVDARGAYHSSRTQLVEDVDASRDVDAAAVDELADRAASLSSRLTILQDDVDAMVRDVAAAEQAMLDAFTSYGSLAKARVAVSGRLDIADTALARPGSPTSGGSPSAVSDWWASLSQDEQYAVLAAHPELLGGTDGIPATVRDDANRLLLETDLEALELREQRGELLYGDREALANARAAQAALVEGAQQVDPINNEPLQPLLHLYDSTAFGGDGKVAIAFGDPDTADHVSVLVPGLWSCGTMAGQYTTDAFNIYESARFSDPDSSVASIMWIGYDAPSDWDAGTCLGEGRATDGGELLSQYVDGLRTSDSGAQAHLTVIGHSYGSTTTGHAATDDGLAADDIVLVGSPGAGGGVDHASDLGVGAYHVWAGNNSRDPVAALADSGWVGGGTLFGAGLGNDVAEDDFGANRFQAESTTRNENLRNFDDHVTYFGQNSESLFNIGQIIVGDYDEVNAAEHTHDPWWGPPTDPEFDRTPTKTHDRKADS